MMSYKNILVIKLKQPGDVLVSTPVLTALKEAWPDTRVTYLVPRAAAEMVEGHPLLDGLLVADRRQETWSRSWRLLQNLWQADFDLVLELSGGDRGAFYSLATRAQETVSFERPGQPFWQRQNVFTRLLPRPPVKMHMVEQNLEAVRALGVEPHNPRLQFFWDEQVEARVADRLKSFGLRPGEFAVLHPGAGWRFKCWTPAGYARVIEYIQEVLGLSVVLTASRAPRTRTCPGNSRRLPPDPHQPGRATHLEGTGRHHRQGPLLFRGRQRPHAPGRGGEHPGSGPVRAFRRLQLGSLGGGTPGDPEGF